jgi:hypothetical protein
LFFEGGYSLTVTIEAIRIARLLEFHDQEIRPLRTAAVHDDVGNGQRLAFLVVSGSSRSLWRSLNSWSGHQAATFDTPASLACAKTGRPET